MFLANDVFVVAPVCAYCSPNSALSLLIEPTVEVRNGRIFQKKSTKGTATPATEIDLIKRRLVEAEQDYKERQALK